MKQLFIALLLFMIGTTAIVAQEAPIVRELNTPKAGQGRIIIYQDESIESLVAGKRFSNIITSPSSGEERENNNASPISYIKKRGYKIQVFSGNDQRRSRNEAQARKNTVASSFPNMEVVVSYSSPVWRVRAGNFQTREQAAEALSELKRQFPSFGREMTIVPDEIKIPVY